MALWLSHSLPASAFANAKGTLIGEPVPFGLALRAVHQQHSRQPK